MLALAQPKWNPTTNHIQNLRLADERNLKELIKNDIDSSANIGFPLLTTPISSSEDTLKLYGESFWGEPIPISHSHCVFIAAYTGTQNKRIPLSELPETPILPNRTFFTPFLTEENIIDWDACLPEIKPRLSKTIKVKLVFKGRGKLAPMDE